MMVMIGVFHIFAGIAALAEDTFFVLGREYAYEVDVTTWGWIHLIGGIVVCLAGLSVLSGALWARTIGVIIALMSALANFVFVPYYPVWSILLIALNVVVIWALAVYRPGEATG
jgi:hypothetical protein